MQIISIRRAPPGTNLRARVDVETPFGVRLFNLAIKETPNGWRVFSPSAFGSATATFSHDFASQIIAAARRDLGENTANEQRAA